MRLIIDTIARSRGAAFQSVPCLEGDIYLVHWRQVRKHALAG